MAQGHRVVSLGKLHYTRNTPAITDATVRWLKQEAACHRDKPWALYVGYVAPHFAGGAAGLF